MQGIVKTIRAKCVKKLHSLRNRRHLIALVRSHTIGDLNKMDMNLHDLFFDVTLLKEMSAFLNYISICQVYICMNDNLKGS